MKNQRQNLHGPPLTAVQYLVGAATDPNAPTYRVTIYAGTEPGDIWSIMYWRHAASEITIRGTTGYLGVDSDDDVHDPVLAWQEPDGLIVQIQSSGGTADSILTFAESLASLSPDEQHAFLEAAQPPPQATPVTSEASATT